MYDFSYFVKDVARWDTTTEVIWGSHVICPTIKQLSVTGVTKAGLTTITEMGGWESSRRQLTSMAYLLLVPTPEAEAKKSFGLTSIWVHPSQSLLFSMEEVAKKLTLLSVPGEADIMP